MRVWLRGLLAVAVVVVLGWVVTPAAAVTVTGEETNPNDCSHLGLTGAYAWYVDFDAGWEYWKLGNCPIGNDPRPHVGVIVWVVTDKDAGEALPVEWCLPPDTVADIGVKGFWQDTFAQNGTIHRIDGPFTDCTAVETPQAPLVRVTGQVVQEPAGPDDQTRPINNAKWELWARIRGGDDPQEPAEWTPLGSEAANAGDPEEGFLDSQGRFDIDFYYPSPGYAYGEDWQMFYGCPQTGAADFFLVGDPPRAVLACAAADVQLRVYAESEDGSVQVSDSGGERELIDTIDLGRFYQRDDGAIYEADHAAAYAYSAAYTVKDFTAGLASGRPLGDVDITLDGTGVGAGGYDPLTGRVELSEFRIGTSEPEFHIASSYLHDLLAEGYPGLPGDCEVASFAEATTEQCGMMHGFAGFIAHAVEDSVDPDRVDDRLILQGKGYDIEQCTVDAFGTPQAACADGAAVPARVSAALRDLTDADNETINGFDDFTTYPVGSVIAVIAEDTPMTVAQFWDGWRSRHDPRDRLVMFMNTLEYVDLQDDDLATADTGTWVDVACPTCRDGRHRFSDPGADPARMTWDFARHLTEAGSYDFWVRLPAGEPGDEQNALYDIHMLDGAYRVVVNHSAAADGWVNLQEAGIPFIDPAGQLRVELSNSTSPTERLNADAIIMAPHDDPVDAEPSPPTVTISGQVLTPRSAGGADRPLAGARWELWYKGRAGLEDDPVQWQPVRPGVGGTGAPVAGYLDAQGGYSASFVYPQDYRLPTGDTWYGCLPTTPPVPFMSSHYCADDELVLRVFPRDETFSIRVTGPDSSGEVEVAEEFPLGQQIEGPATHHADSGAAQVFGGVLNVREHVGYFGDVRVDINDDGDSGYDPWFGTIDIIRTHTGTSAVEHEVAHQVADHLLGSEFPSWTPCDGDHSFALPNNEECAWFEGFANFLAVVSENEPGSTSMSRFRASTLWLDIEDCTVEFDTSPGNGFACEDGPAVEGNVTAALWDLLDGPTTELAEESHNAFYDRSSYSLTDILDVVDEANPSTFAEFWQGWLARFGHDLDTRGTMWLNSLLYSAVEESSLQKVTGAWDEVLCETCHWGSYQRALPLQEHVPTLTWDLNSVFKSHSSTDPWDIWVHLPVDTQLDTAATYTLTTLDGATTVTIDQNTAGPGGRWVRLNSSGSFFLEPRQDNVVVLSGRNGKAVVADAILVEPSEYQPG